MRRAPPQKGRLEGTAGLTLRDLSESKHSRSALTRTANLGADTMATTLTQDELLDAIGNMTVLELSEFVKAFEEKFGVTAAAPVAVAAGAGAGGGGAAPAAEEKSEFDVILTSAGEKK